MSSSTSLSSLSFRHCLSDAARFWERGRIAYNLILGGTFALWVITTWPHFRAVFTFAGILPFIGLALIANLLYASAYLIDLPAQLSASRTWWLRYRWGLWIMGMLLALLLENYWISDEIYPFIQQ